MWTAQPTEVSPTTIQYQISQDGSLLTFSEAIEAWKTLPDFRSFYREILAIAPFPAFFWELPPMVQADLHKPFEFVLVNSSTLANIQANGRSFQKKFEPNKAIVSFTNLGGDATLIVPCPQAEAAVYPHLAQFIRQGPKEQIDALWQQVGSTYDQLLSQQPLWLSTSGLGVYWLHIRLDKRPKYYTHMPYRSPKL